MSERFPLPETHESLTVDDIAVEPGDELYRFRDDPDHETEEYLVLDVVADGVVYYRPDVERYGHYPAEALVAEVKGHHPEQTDADTDAEDVEQTLEIEHGERARGPGEV